VRGPDAAAFLKSWYGWKKADLQTVNFPVMLLYSPLYGFLSKHKQAVPFDHLFFRRMKKLGNRGILPLAMGGPLAAQQAEHLLALGCPGIMQAGIAGSMNALYPSGTLVSAERVINETGAAAAYGYPFFSSLPVNFESVSGISDSAAVWSTDAVYCETEDKLQKMKDLGSDLVEMESAPLAAVCLKYDKPFQAVYTVSDELFSKEWQPDFQNETVKNGMSALAGVLSRICTD